jgi:hypothetical protein
LLPMILTGWKRVSKPKNDERSPITIDEMRILKNKLRGSDINPQDQHMMWSAFTLAFFGLLRVSEFTHSSQSSTEKPPALAGCDVSLVADNLFVTIRKDKTNQSGPPVFMKFKATSRSCCVVRSARNYISLRPPNGSNLPFFVYKDGTFLTRQRLSAVIHKLLGPTFKSHSFRIGAATTAAEAGFPVDTIRKLGRWKSNAYQTYIRPSKDSLSEATSRLARSVICYLTARVIMWGPVRVIQRQRAQRSGCTFYMLKCKTTSELRDSTDRLPFT